MSVEPLNARAGEEVLVRGRIDPPMSAPIMIIVEEPDGSTKTIETKTNDEGLFSISIKPEKAGVHVVRAVFSGSELYEPSSTEAFVEVKAPPSPLISALLEGIYYVVVVLVVVVGTLIALLKSPYVKKGLEGVKRFTSITAQKAIAQTIKLFAILMTLKMTHKPFHFDLHSPF
jgi:hypothetical protein